MLKFDHEDRSTLIEVKQIVGNMEENQYFSNVAERIKAEVIREVHEINQLE